MRGKAKTSTTKIAAAPKPVAESLFDPEQLVSQADLTKLFDCDQTTISKLTTNGVLEREGGRLGRNGSGLYRLGASMRNYLAYKVRQSKEINPLQARRSTALSRQSEAAATIAEMTLAEKRGRLIETDFVEFYMTDLLTRMRNEILTVPRRITRKSTGKNRQEIIKLIDSEIIERLRYLASPEAIEKRWKHLLSAYKASRKGGYDFESDFGEVTETDDEEE
jgi:phage terminase Nu1 subunit (DNA packaging protein)